MFTWLAYAVLHSDYANGEGRKKYYSSLYSNEWRTKIQSTERATPEVKAISVSLKDIFILQGNKLYNLKKKKKKKKTNSKKKT